MRRAATLATAVFIFASSAQADSIDGDWCNSKDEHLTITGPQITLPTGKSLAGQYRRHEFAYQIPVGEPNAGQRIYMQLYDEYDMTSYVIENEKPANPMNWTRCPVVPKTS
jgi:hypothetical protein